MTIIISNPSVVNPNNNRQGYQSRGNIGYHSYGNIQSGSRPYLSNSQRPQQTMDTHTTSEAHTLNSNSEEYICHESIEQ